ncbi:hypothetical protein P692DRAFT_20846259 [Suillus brevipes Sb2]|nr:hypothetical protein P692DRAFT_20846259 [Suillus brevipes Sb2]
MGFGDADKKRVGFSCLALFSALLEPSSSWSTIRRAMIGTDVELVGTRWLLYVFRIYPFPRIPFEVVENALVLYYFRRMRSEGVIFTGSTCRCARDISSSRMRRVF